MSSSSNKQRAFFSLFVLAGALVLTSACGDDAPAPAPVSTKAAKQASTACFTNQNPPKGFMPQSPMIVHGEPRTYDWLVPDSEDGVHPIPVVFVFDGVNGKGASARATYPLEAAAAGTAIFVYPDTDTSGQWDITRGPEDNQDVQFYEQILDAIESTYCVDTNRVFVTGFGNGATFANQLGCFRGDDLRAVAAHAGTGPQSEEFSATGTLECPQKPIAAIITHGSADTTVTTSDAEASRDYWAAVNGCRPGGLQTFETYAPCINLLECSPDRPVVYCEIPGLDHSLWPEAATATWAFFQQL